jgi:hypothetical protein
VDDGQISIPGLQVLPIVKLDETPVPPVPRSARQSSRDDVIMK